jgi:imidazolonepropionase-like amidohydrolase
MEDKLEAAKAVKESFKTFKRVVEQAEKLNIRVTLHASAGRESDSFAAGSLRDDLTINMEV